MGLNLYGPYEQPRKSTNKTTQMHFHANLRAPSCLRFINSDNVGMAQFELTHQFTSYRLDDVGFAAGTVQALHVGEFLYSDSSTPSNFTVFAFYEQAPPPRAAHKCHYLRPRSLIEERHIPALAFYRQ